MADRTIRSIPKNRREAIHVSLKHWQGRDLGDIRVYTPISEATGVMAPSKAGLSFALRLLPDLISALQETERQARAEGLLNEAAT
jgi:hypothetical protein